MGTRIDNAEVPRVVLAGTNSGCGKTTVTCAVLQALVNRNCGVGAFKCGPDYIDPMFHSRIIGTPCRNLDSFFFDDNTLKYLLVKNGAGRTINVIEGVMGFYDGLNLTDVRASTYEISQITSSPVVLVVGARGAAMSVLAVLQGFLSLYPDNRICGVILNQCTEMTYRVLEKEIRSRFCGRIRPLGFLPSMPECALESRHLGLVTAAEVADLREKMQLLAGQAERSIDLDGLTEIAEKAPSISCKVVEAHRYKDKIRIAVAEDKAFCFYYDDSVELLKEMGAELVPFSPLTDPELPADIHGLYLGGGYPELYAKKLSMNRSMLTSVRCALERGLPCIAECGGFMYLTESIGEYPAVGYLQGACSDTGKLTRFGYVRLKAKTDNMLCRAGDEIPGHEFHHWDCSFPGGDFTAEKLSGRHWDCVYATDRLYAGYPHFHFYANPQFAVRFYETCLKEKYQNV